jgi:hypothetical protein
MWKPSKKLRNALMALPMVALLASCAPSGSVNDYCLIAEPIYVGEGDVFEDATARAVLKHNETGAALCGW